MEDQNRNQKLNELSLNEGQVYYLPEGLESLEVGLLSLGAFSVLIIPNGDSKFILSAERTRLEWGASIYTVGTGGASGGQGQNGDQGQHGRNISLNLGRINADDTRRGQTRRVCLRYVVIQYPPPLPPNPRRICFSRWVTPNNQLYVASKGGLGGVGGKGNIGRTGSPARCTGSAAEDGGRGGRGKTGGYGGNGGSIEVIAERGNLNVSDALFLSIPGNGGAGGAGGRGGAGGAGKRCLGYRRGSGNNGPDGIKGKDGEEGNSSTVTIDIHD
ncbi:hypothetical protein J1N10_00955 [Carboxylicivirga sp. A043]|uniref:hypothetical protein n=1 Tax=Carboxylicivirga litoralis TaxID=2816963 RepID=UPI0021CB4FD1|nr:hypothetical protein [Carboxylicivirga sp. A043]MCU4154522.1 hypothetical protein [Carboxylicivirga sp. A043]